MQAMRVEAQSFGVSRPVAVVQQQTVQTQVDATTQADLVGYESEDERMGRRRTKRCAPPYSKEDIREQYCISKKQVQVLESHSPSALFGCLSKHHDSSCHSKHSILTKCVDRAPSDENLHESSRQPLPRRPMDDLERAYLRRRPKSICASDPRRYAWIPEDEEPCRMEHARSLVPEQELLLQNHEYPLSFSSEHIATTCPAHYLPPPPPPPAGASRIKHVSFARSHTLTSFDDAIMELRRTPSTVFKSQERLILSTQSMKRIGPPMYQTYEQRSTKKPPMKTQATQTGCVGKEPPTYLSLSPRTVHKVRMMSQGAQTNGQLCSGRKLMKSYSEAGDYHFGAEGFETEKKDHDLLTRTQSEEPRSPYSKTTNLLWGSEGMRNQEAAKQRSSRVYKEIFIDFEPADSGPRSRQSFTQSEAAFISDYNMEEFGQTVVDRVDGVKVSLSSYSSAYEDEGQAGDHIDRQHIMPKPQDSVDEEFHENLVYGGMFHKRSTDELDKCKRNGRLSGRSTPEQQNSMPVPSLSTLTVSRRVSPFTSNDSLTTDHRAEHSDGNWNESQSTVLQAESDNGSGRSTSKKHLLMLHQQRSSIDTEALEDDYLQSQSSIFSPLKDTKVPSVTIAKVHQESPSSIDNNKKECARAGKGSSLSPGIRETRRKMVKSPEKDAEPFKRRDSGRVTDISETSTTDDYATAHDNSGEDTVSSRHQQGSKTGSKEGSSFESASSLPGNSKEDHCLQIVPTSPPPIHEESINYLAEFEEKIVDDLEDMGRPYSSSSGSYSLESCPKDCREWTQQEKSWAKRGFKLDLSDQSAEHHEIEDAASVSQSNIPTSPKKAKTKNAVTRKTQQVQIKKWSNKSEDLTAGMVRSPAMPEGFRGEDWAPPQRTTPSQTPEEMIPTKTEVIISSDESSCETTNTGKDETINGHSPRRQRKRGGRGRRGQDLSTARRPLAPLSGQPTSQQRLTALGQCRSPAHSPKGSPRKPAKGTKRTEQKTNEDNAGAHLKAVSAESLRSVSPGSDSVFYNEEESLRHCYCYECRRDIDDEAKCSKYEKNTTIVMPPPELFADSAESLEGSQGNANRLFIKQDRRFRSEKRTRKDQRHRAEGQRAKSEERGKEVRSDEKLRPHAHSTDASVELLETAEKDKRYRSEGRTGNDQRNRTDGQRAKSEERGKGERSEYKLRPHAHSTDASVELLQTAHSSPSISERLTEGDQQIYADSLKSATWMRIEDLAYKVIYPGKSSKSDPAEENDDSPTELTPTEKKFKKSFVSATAQFVHRKASMAKFLREQNNTYGSMNLRERLEEIFRLMLKVWCTQKKALTNLKTEADKKVIIPREGAREFGLRIHGSHPLVISRFEPNSPAGRADLQVGDIVLTVNGVSVLGLTHPQIVDLCYSGSALEVEVVRTDINFIPSPQPSREALKCGFLHKLSADGQWYERWFVLRTDNCLYYYYSKAERQPLGAILLINYKFCLQPDSSRRNSFRITKEGAKSLELSAHSAIELEDWRNAIETAMAVEVSKQSLWFERSCQFLNQPAASVYQPDCFGHLTHLEDKWRRRYCILKDAALLLYTDSAARKALAIICLQGYTVENEAIADKKWSFKLVPPESKLKRFYFNTDSEVEKKRWILAIHISTGQWMKIDS